MHKLVLPLLAIAILMGLTGCPSVPSNSQAPFITKDQNLIVHSYSGIPFPAAIGLFTRDRTTVYDPSGMDVGATYNCLTPIQITATVYAFPSPHVVSFGSPADVIHSARENLSTSYFNEVKNEITRRHPDAIEIQSKNLDGPESTIGKFAEYKLTEPFWGQTQALTSRLYLFTYFQGKWSVKYRFTYPSSAEADKAVDDFVKKHKWTASESAKSGGQ